MGCQSRGKKSQIWKSIFLPPLIVDLQPKLFTQFENAKDKKETLGSVE